eukprot:Tbor_TRINITY_DN6085_c0_g1::TRINITY_DN6085_c0_g1_i1::g.10773::m.10773
MMYEVTADNDIIIGRLRPKNNPLICRKLLGKSSYHNGLPPLPAGHTFGSPPKRDPDTVGQLMVCLPVSPQISSRKGFVADKRKVYGIKTEEASYMQALIENRFQLEWVNLQREHYERMEMAERKRKRKKKAHLNVTLERDQWIALHSLGDVKPHPREYFTMRQFRDVPSRLSTVNVEYCRSLSRNRSGANSKNEQYNRYADVSSHSIPDHSDRLSTNPQGSSYSSYADMDINNNKHQPHHYSHHTKSIVNPVCPHHGNGAINHQ